MTTIVDKGDRLRTTATFTVNTVPSDPTTIVLHVLNAAGAISNYTYLASSIVRDGIGLYHFDIDVDQEGDWRVRWEGTGNVVAVVEDFFSCSATPFS